MKWTKTVISSRFFIIFPIFNMLQNSDLFNFPDFSFQASYLLTVNNLH